MSTKPRPINYIEYANEFLRSLNPNKEKTDRKFQEILNKTANPGVAPVFNHVGGDMIKAPGAGVVNTGKIGDIYGDISGSNAGDTTAAIQPTYRPGYLTESSPDGGNGGGGGGGGNGGQNDPPGIETPGYLDEQTEQAVDDALKRYKWRGEEYDYYNGNLNNYDYTSKNGANRFSLGNARDLKDSGNYSDDQLTTYMNNLADEGANIQYAAGKYMDHDFGEVGNIQDYDSSAVGNERFNTGDVKHLLDEGYTKGAVIKAAQQADENDNLGNKQAQGVLDPDSDWWNNPLRTEQAKGNTKGWKYGINQDEED